MAGPSGSGVAWEHYEGSSQELFLACPYWECLYHGNRGSMKTDSLLMDFAQHVGQGFGPGWRGILFRRTYKQLADIVARTRKWFPRIFPGAKFNAGDYRWTFPDGEEFLLRHMWNITDYENYHGHEYPFLAFEELSNWLNDECYEAMKSCSRSSHPGMPRKIRATTNSWGAGHTWIKNYFINAAPVGQAVATGVLERVHIQGDVLENKALLAADPDYVARLDAIKDENKRKAWRYGSWDIVAGTYFGDVWDATVHVIPPFEVPRSWTITRNHDWGSTRPFAWLWVAESNGDPAMLSGERWQPPRGTLVVVGEYYGWNGQPNAGLRLTTEEMARRTLATEHRFPWGPWIREGVGDPSLWTRIDGVSLADKLLNAGLSMKPAPHVSRVQGWQECFDLLAASCERPMEFPGLFVTNTCEQLIRTLPILPQDPDDPADLDSESEDH